VFIAFAPADNPKLAVAVVVPWGGYGSWGAAPIAAKIFEAYYEYIGFDGKPAGPLASTLSLSGGDVEDSTPPPETAQQGAGAGTVAGAGTSGGGTAQRTADAPA